MDYEKEPWFVCYRAAMLETDTSAIADRIAAARTAIEARLRDLSVIPGFHNGEREAIADVVRNLLTLERVNSAPKA